MVPAYRRRRESCPDLQHRLDPEVLVCHTCRLVYPVEDGIPIMLIDEAKPL